MGVQNRMKARSPKYYPQPVIKFYQDRLLFTVANMEETKKLALKNAINI